MRLIKTTCTWNTEVQIDRHFDQVINTLDCIFGCGNRSEAEVLRTGSLFRGREYLEWYTDEGTVICEAIYVDHYIAPNPIDQFCKLIETYRYM